MGNAAGSSPQALPYAHPADLLRADQKEPILHGSKASHGGLLRTSIAPETNRKSFENRPGPERRFYVPTIHVQVRFVCFREGINYYIPHDQRLIKC